MSLFKKKRDPIAEREKLLNERIAALEEEIQHLASQPPPMPAVPAFHSNSTAVFTPATPVQAQPRLRSTARPHGQATPATTTPALHEPVFEEVGKDRLNSDAGAAPPAPPNDLGVRKNDLATALGRLKRHFRGPPTSNPKLVHYLSAGSIQGLRPLRYEKRVARNRVITLAVLLMVLLWGIIAFFYRRN
jgi:hypothetical protein